MGLSDPFSYGSYLVPQAGVPALIYFDCVVSETVTRDAETTEFPVEVGANISDHYRVKLTGLKLEVFCSNEPLNAFTHPEGTGFYGAQSLDFGAHPYPDRNLLATVATAVVNPVGLITSVVGNLLFGGDQRPTAVGSVLQFQNKFDSLQGLLTSLDFIRSTAGLVDIATRSQYYDSFVIGQVTTSRDKGTGTGSKVTIEFKKIAQVQTQTTGAPPIPAKPKDKPPVNKGAQQLKPPGQMQSAASALLGKISGAAGH